MTKAELNELGLTAEEAMEFFDEEVEFDDVEETIEETTEVEEVTGEVMSETLQFKSVKEAAQFLADKLDLKITNTVDCLYKCLKKENSETHNYKVTRNEDKSIILEAM